MDKLFAIEYDGAMLDAKFTEIIELERELMSTSIKRDQSRLNQLLDPDFFEIGSSGKLWSREAVINALPLHGDMAWSSSDFEATELDSNLVLLTFKTESSNAECATTRSLRSSLWRNSGGTWKLLFHQGTPIP